VRAIDCPEFLAGGAEIVIDRVFGQIEDRGDLLAGFAAGGPLQAFALACAQNIFLFLLAVSDFRDSCKKSGWRNN
jgi:hypothetical protein